MLGSFTRYSLVCLLAAMLAVPPVAQGAPRGRANARRAVPTAPRATKGKRPAPHAARASLAGPRRGSLARPRPGETNVAPRGITPLEQELQDSLGRILSTRWLKSSVNGVYVLDPATQRVLYSFGADRQLNPASNVKLVSTATALQALGSDFRYHTRLLGPAPTVDGVIPGDVYLVGNADPLLRREHLAQLAHELAASGIHGIQGDIVVGTGELRDGIGHAAVSVTVTAGSKNGEPARVTVEPESPLFVVQSSARTSTGRRPKLGVGLRVVKSPEGERIVVSVSGKVKAGRRVRADRAVPRAALYAAHELKRHLGLAGISVSGSIRREAEPPAGATELAVHESVPFATLAAMVNKPSSNFLADRMIWTTGGELFGGEPNNAKGLRAMQGFLEKLGLTTGSYRLDNGSGLSHTNHLSARQVVSVLMAGAEDTSCGPDYVASLSVGGRDGTLKGRFRGRPSAGWVRGKTGTLNGVAALSGFVAAGGDDQLVFAILTNGFRNRRRGDIRAAQAAMVDAMHGYLAKLHAEKTGATPTGVVTPDVTTLESDTPLPDEATGEGMTPGEIEAPAEGEIDGEGEEAAPTPPAIPSSGSDPVQRPF